MAPSRGRVLAEFLFRPPKDSGLSIFVVQGFPLPQSGALDSKPTIVLGCASFLYPDSSLRKCRMCLGYVLGIQGLLRSGCNVYGPAKQTRESSTNAPPRPPKATTSRNRYLQFLKIPQHPEKLSFGERLFLQVRSRYRLPSMHLLCGRRSHRRCLFFGGK